ncbi:M48 family metallopeptidase [Colwellia sp. BRX8-9]|uniref:tetratricopeptide repeat protein n=1 Tax=Colwellia sp. BRX8-9 TaxID=2759831 RepID=UPI0015F4B751|nr:hypothetical protein [Colwellia sp. BRX8-9]MBA6350287.1 hypothetical protein [Colwellia sp. BRX8-9]
MNIKKLFSICMIFSGLFITGCANKSTSNQVYAPNEQLDELLTRYVKIKVPKPKCQTRTQQLIKCRMTSFNREEMCLNNLASNSNCKKAKDHNLIDVKALMINLNCHDNSKPIVDCFRFASELNALYLKYPNHKRIMMTSALVEFEIGNTNTSQQLLDLILSKRGAFPEAAILRSRIAMEEGNLTLARTIVKRQLSVTPYNPHLYELQAAYYYLEGKYTKALQAITSAERFMESDWRINYHRGIIYEAQQQWYKACKEYTGVLREQPDNQMMSAKILLLREHIGCFVNPA